MPHLLLPINKLENHISDSGNASDLFLKRKESFASVSFYRIFIPGGKIDRLKDAPKINHPSYGSEIDLGLIDIGSDNHPPNFGLDDKIFFVHVLGAEGLISNALRTASNNSSGS